MQIFKKGTSIIEIVIATALISMAIIAALSLVNQSQKQNTYARDLAQATKYATQGADWIRNQRTELGFATLNSMNEGIYCMETLPISFTSLETGACDDASFIQGTIFQREVSISKTVDGLKIIITVSWMEQVERQAKIEMELTSWH